MQLLDLDTEGFLGLPDGRYNFADAKTGTAFPISLVTGPSGSGKTTLLDAIIVLKESVGSRLARPALSRYLRFGAHSGRLAGRFLLTPEEQASAELPGAIYSASFDLTDTRPRRPEPLLQQLFSGVERGSGHGAFEYFPCNRQLVPRVGYAPGDESAAHRLTRRVDKYAGVERFFAQLVTADGLDALARIDGDGLLLKGEQQESLASYRSAIRALCPRLHLLRVDLAPDGPVVWFERAGGVRVDLYRLSQAEQQAVLVATTFLRYRLSSSLVLIDGPELHIHPTEHAPFFTALAALGGQSQIVAVTDAPGIAALVSREQVITLGKQ